MRNRSRHAEGCSLAALQDAVVGQARARTAERKDQDRRVCEAAEEYCYTKYISYHISYSSTAEHEYECKSVRSSFTCLWVRVELTDVTAHTMLCSHKESTGKIRRMYGEYNMYCCTECCAAVVRARVYRTAAKQCVAPFVTLDGGWFEA